MILSQIEYLEVGVAIVMATSLIALLGAVSFYLLSKIDKQGDRLTTLEGQSLVSIEKSTGIEELKEMVQRVWTEIDNIKRTRTEDVIGFTEALGKFNTTLARLEQTMEHLNRTMSDLGEKVDNIRDDRSK